MDIKHVEGQDYGKVMLYALSTCGWCRKTKQLLNQLGIAYDYVDVDQLEGVEKDTVVKEIMRWNPKCSFPTVVINDSQCVVGYDEEKIKGIKDNG